MSTSSTRDSERFRYALSAIACVGLMFAVVTGLLHGVSEWAEREASSYPWGAEDYLRYLVPTMVGASGRNTILIAGPSEAREALLYEEFEDAFPGTRTVQGGLSVGTLDDFLLALDYWRRMFGDDAIPRTLVIGVTPRFVANIPRRERIFARSLTRYSPRYKVDYSPYHSTLVEKRVWEGALARGRFLLKQPGRYRAALCTVFLRTLLRSRPEAFTAVAARSGEPTTARFMGRRPSLARVERCRSPYHYRGGSPESAESIERGIRHPDSFWYEAHHWNPEAELSEIRAQFERLRRLAAELDVEVFAVNLPEHPLNRAGYDPAAYASYLELVRESFEPTHFLELRELIAAGDFYDAGHVTVNGAHIVTDTTIAFLRHAGGRAGAGHRKDVARSRRSDP